MTSEQWYFSKEYLNHLPSLKDNITKEQELEYRKSTCAFIQEAGKQLNL